MWIRSTKEGVELTVRLQPRASRSKIIGVRDDALKIAVGALPIKGEANRECLKLLAKTLGIPFSALCIVSGETSRQKRISVNGVSVKEVTTLLV